MEDPTIRRLTKKVFPYLWVRHKLMSSAPSTGIFPLSEMTVFSQGIGNAIIVYLHMYRPTLSNYLEKHIPSMPHSKMQFWTHAAFLCLQVRLNIDNVFDYFLTTYAITAEVALYCYVHEYDDVLSLASAFFCAFFENELSDGFHKSGGCEGLQRYIEDTSCKELYELVDWYIKKLISPNDHLPILISIQNEQLAARRREKFMSLLSFKIGEIEREDQTKTLVSRIFHWYFMENNRISEAKSGILKRMENVRLKKCKSNISINGAKYDDSPEADEILEADIKISNTVEPLCLHDKARPPESITTMSETRFSNKAMQTLDDSMGMTVIRESENQYTNDETSAKVKFSSSSSLRELRNFYESLSASCEKKAGDSKYLKTNNGTCGGLNSSSIKESANEHKKVSHFERYPRFVPYSNENGETFPKSKKVTDDTELLHVNDPLSEFTESLQELGFKCLCVGNSSHLDKKSANFTNYAEVIEKCRQFQNKYSIQFAILIPNYCFTNGTSDALETENKQFSNISKTDFNNCAVSLQKPLSEMDKTTVEATKFDKNQFRLANGCALLQNCVTENVHKSRFVVTKVKENLSSIGGTSKFALTKVNENQEFLRDDTRLLEGKCATAPTTVSRFRITKVNDNQLKDRICLFRKQCTNATTKISRFTVTKVHENESKDGANVKNETTKISRFTVTKVPENESKEGASTRNETTKVSRFTVRKIDENQFKSRAGMSLLRKSYPAYTTKVPKFADTRIGGNHTSCLDRNYFISSEMSSDTENETVHFQDNGSVKYQKRVSFAEHPFITYYQTYSSDESSNSITSRESLNQNSSEDARSSGNSRLAAEQEDTLNLPILENSRLAAEQEDTLNLPILENSRVTERQSSQRLTSGDRQSQRDRAENCSGFFDRIFRRSTSNSKADESKTENKEEIDNQKIKELEKSLESAGFTNSVVFKI